MAVTLKPQPIEQMRPCLILVSVRPLQQRQLDGFTGPLHTKEGHGQNNLLPKPRFSSTPFCQNAVSSARYTSPVSVAYPIPHRPGHFRPVEYVTVEGDP